jgi:methionyl-tRNA formyltransferase
MKKKELRIVFMGTPDFAVESLKEILKAGKKVVGVITAPDRKAGRGQQISESAVKKFSKEKGLTILQPNNLKDESFLKELKELKADLQIIVAFRMLLEVVWSMPPLGSFNLHGSLLPKYRGAAPINWAIINGEKTTGVTTFFLSHKIDTGEIIDSIEIPISKSDNVGTLHDKLMRRGAELVVKTINNIENNKIKTLPQDLNVGYPEAPKLFKENCKINWDQPAIKIDYFIRGLSPYPAAWTELKKSDGNILSFKIFKVLITEEKSKKVAHILEKDGKILIGTSDFYLEIIELQLSGKKRMLAKDFLNGIKLVDYEIHLESH